MTNKQQTAVQWLVDKLIKGEFINSTDELVEQALEMEQEQIIDAVSKGFDNCEEGKVRWLGEHYYNETYKGGEQ